MKLKYLFFCLALLGLMSCESETTTETGSTDTTATNVADAPEGPTHNLKWNVSQDYSFVQKGKQAEKITTYPGSNQEQVSKMAVTASRKYVIGEMDKEGAFHVSMNYVGVMGEFKGPNGKWMYDSNSKESKGQPGNGLENLPGTNVQFRIDPNTGQVIEVFDSEELDKIVAAGSGQIEAPDKVVREALQPEWYVYPDGPKAIGSAWTRDLKMKYQYQIGLTMNFKIASIENDQAKIVFNATAVPLPKGEMVMGKTESGESFYHELNGSSDGEIIADAASGVFLSQTSTTVLEGHKVVLDANGLEKERIPLKIEMEGFSEYIKN